MKEEEKYSKLSLDVGFSLSPFQCVVFTSRIGIQ